MKKTLIMTILLGLTGFFSSLFAEVPALKMIKIPGKTFEMTVTEITQKQYKSVMEENPSWFQSENNELKDYQIEALQNVENTDNLPVENVSIFDAIVFCNKLSRMSGYKPVYAVDGETDETKWEYTPHKGKFLSYDISVDEKADGYRLPDTEEWYYAARCGKNIDLQYLDKQIYKEQAWFDGDWGTTHEVATKKANEYGLYDMLGNVSELYWQDLREGYDIYNAGGNFQNELYEGRLTADLSSGFGAWRRSFSMGFRIVRNY